MDKNNKIHIPPIKSQGIKTKLLPSIRELLSHSKTKYKRWVEPFMGTGVVGFNCLTETPKLFEQPVKHLMCDVNPYIIAFYQDLQSGKVNEDNVRVYLEQQSIGLQNGADNFYKQVRVCFNEYHSPFDFLFLTRCCFNGMMRFNNKGEFNVPFCKKPDRLSPAYITKICNQVKAIREIIQNGDFEFKCQDYIDTLKDVHRGDIVYCDPPYSGLHTDYYQSWNNEDDLSLYYALNGAGADFIVSTWVENSHRKNEFVDVVWKRAHYPIQLVDHFYHIGSTEAHRHSMKEGLVYYFRENEKKHKVYSEAMMVGEFDTLKEAEDYAQYYSEHFDKRTDILSPL